MSDKKISELDAITGANTATDDFFIVVDTSGSATKKISRAELTNSLEVEFNRLNSNLNLNGNDITGTGNINVTGNVSIGTASPNKSSSSIALTVNTGTAANFSALELSSGDTLNWHINANNSNVFDVTAGTRNRIFYTNGAERMRITSGGSVGIGTTSPSAQFHSLGASGTVQTRTSVTGSTASDVAEVAVATGSRTYLVQSKGSTGDFVIRDSTGAADRVTLTSGGNVGIGTSPTYKFQVAAGTDSLVTYSASALNSNIFFDTQNTSTGASAAVVQRLITSDVAGTGSISADFQKTKAGALNINNNETNSAAYTGFGVGGSERMRLDGSGNLLVGKTSAASNVVGAFILNSGLIRADVDGGVVGVFNRKTSDGDALVIQKDGSTVGSIGTTNKGGVNELYIGTGDTGLYYRAQSDAITPCTTAGGSDRDNAIDLGFSSIRFDDIYATNGTIQTSDQQEKNTITDSDLGLDFINRLSPKSYIFNGKTRTHYGLIAQDVETVLGDISKPTSGFAGFIKSDISDEQDGSEYRYGLRYTEFVGPLIQAIKDLKAENDAMRARLDALEAN
jgi:hypothetical protein